MLFLLTGDVQIGKTRWLQAVVEQLQTQNVLVAGVLSPGIWVPRTTQPQSLLAGTGPYEKRGINCMLLPEGDTLPFAQRRDLAVENGTLNPESVSEGMQLGWHIDDSAIDRVNEHFAALATRYAGTSGLLVIDEFGQLELKREQGFTSALHLVDSGPRAGLNNALIIVRDRLVPLARERFEPVWGDACLLSPDDDSRALLMAELSRPTPSFLP